MNFHIWMLSFLTNKCQQQGIIFKLGFINMCGENYHVLKNRMAHGMYLYTGKVIQIQQLHMKNYGEC